MPIAGLYSAATFYHYFSVGDAKPTRRGICRGPVCGLPGFAVGYNNKESPSIACPSLCDQPVAEYASGTFCSSSGTEGGYRLPGSVVGGQVIFRQIHSRQRESLDAYRARGGYEQWLVLLKDQTAAKGLEELRASGLRGRGGAGFSLAEKWPFYRQVPRFSPF